MAKEAIKLLEKEVRKYKKRWKNILAEYRIQRKKIEELEKRLEKYEPPRFSAINTKLWQAEIEKDIKAGAFFDVSDPPILDRGE